jgi:hypothetical protein
MLTIELKGDILHVTEVTHGWTDTPVRYIRYDVKNWRTNSIHNQTHPLDLEMYPEQIEWVKKHYLSKVA